MRAIRHHGAAPALLTGPETSFAAPSSEEAPLLSLAQLWSILRARRRMVLLLVVSLAVLSAIIIKLLPQSYEATATMIVSFQLKQGQGEADMPMDMLGTYMATQIDLMQSPEVLLPVVDKLNLTHDPEFSGGYKGGDSAAVRHYSMTLLAKKVAITQGQGSQLLYVTATSKDPVKAAKIANAIADVYSAEERQRLKDPADDRVQNYSQQLAELKAKVMAAQQKVTELRQQTGVLTLANDGAPGANDPDNQTLISLEQQLLAAQNTRRMAESVASLAPVMDGAGEGAVVPPQIHDLTADINAKTLQLSELSTTYGPRHPKVIALQTELNQARDSLRREAARFLEQSRKAEDQLQHAVDAQRQKMLSVRKVQDQASKLELELESAQSVYKRALDGYDQIVFASLGNTTNVGFVSRATTPVEPANSNKNKLMIIAALASLLIGFGAPIIYELFADRRLYCRDDVERYFGVPVLAEFGIKSIPTLVGSK
ncbi:MAG TPA: Wzz/FepE/Etk N-terminal domain-containing protein [Steroidobacteraceae bacterium]|nr:Wzz/FepE/Etk N-terminal domain-containing protein [Steroidobacteraceae bacterium]